MRRHHPLRSASFPAGLLVVVMLAACYPELVRAQEGGGAGTSCTLRWESLTDSTGSRSIQIGPDRYRHHVWNGMRWFCGDAIMIADSAVQFPGQRVEMVGAVHYRDSIRTLDSQRLTYFQLSDLVEARDSVRLVRRATGSTLHAPSVDLYRAGSGEIRQTVATGGARMVVYPAADSPAAEREPFHVTSDTAIILREDVTLARGNVVVTREEVRGTGAFGRFDTGEGRGMLTGEPVLTGEDFRLTGDTTRIATEDGELREVQADGSGHLVSGGMDVRAPRIRVAIRQDQVETLWAFGGGARSRSASRLMLGDSLHFAFADGGPDSTTAVGEAAAVELAPGDTLALEQLLAGRSGVRAAPGDSAAVPAEPDTAGRTAPADTTGTAVADTKEGPETDTTAGPEGELFGTGRDWIRGDTVRAYFARADTARTTQPEAPGDTAARKGEVTLRELRAIGTARSYYRVSRDTARDRPGRSYLRGSEITIVFREGEPHRVRGTMAIGVYLEPASPGQAGAPGPPAPADTGRVIGDTIPPADTAGAAADTTAASRGNGGIPTGEGGNS